MNVELKVREGWVLNKMIMIMYKDRRCVMLGNRVLDVRH